MLSAAITPPKDSWTPVVLIRGCMDSSSFLSELHAFGELSHKTLGEQEDHDDEREAKDELPEVGEVGGRCELHGFENQCTQEGPDCMTCATENRNKDVLAGAQPQTEFRSDQTLNERQQTARETHHCGGQQVAAPHDDIGRETQVFQAGFVGLDGCQRRAVTGAE